MRPSFFRRWNTPIPVRRLSFKIFIWFLLTTWGVLTVFFLRTQLSGMKIVREPNMYATVAPILAEQAVQAYEAGGAAKFAEFSQGGGQHHEPRLFLLDGMYQDVLKRVVPGDGIRTAHAARQGQLVVFRGYIAGIRTISPSGRPYVLLLYLKNPLGAAKESLTGQGSWVLGGVLLFVPLLCFWLAYHIASPIHAIQLAARRIAEGDLQARAPDHVLRRHDELAALGTDFNSMVDRISTLLSSHKTLLASVSHELRSPLARLSVAIEMLRRGEPEQSRRLLERMGRDITLMDHLLGQLLTLSRFDAGMAGAHVEVIDLVHLAEQVAADGAFEAEASGKRVLLKTNAHPLLLLADAFALRKACENVLRNAIRFSPVSDPVALSVATVHRKGRQYATITVSDRGPGVPESALKEIFRPFFRITSDAMASQSNGLGLAIVAGAVQLHGGEVTASNRQSGGLEVVISLPLDN